MAAVILKEESEESGNINVNSKEQTVNIGREVNQTLCFFPLRDPAAVVHPTFLDTSVNQPAASYLESPPECIEML